MIHTSLRGVRAAAVVALLALVTACGDDSDADVSAGGADDGGGMVHVHGLGVNPADGALYVATHYGTFRLGDDGAAERVGPVQDMMGFTVAGDDNFVGSGHPGGAMAAEGVVNPLGFIESTDAGETWTSVSLSGEVDFHALTYAHDQIYGWNASGAELLVSSDGEDWETRAEGVALLSLAVDPDDPDRIVAVAFEEGRQESIFQGSTDGGRTWEELPGVNWMAWLSWDAGSGLWAVDQNGDVYQTSDPEGGDWEQVGAAGGPPQAFLADGDTLYLATADEGTTRILTSTDAGESWETLYEGA